MRVGWLSTIGVPLLTVGVLCCSCGRRAGTLGTGPPSLTGEEESLAQQVGFETDALLAVKQETTNALAALKDPEGKTIGVQSDVAQDEATDIVGALRRTLEPMGYLAFQSEMNFGSEPDRIGIIKSTDQYDILRSRQTDGINYGLTNEAVVAKLQEWEAKSAFQIIGADFDWVEVEFETVPEDIDAFAREVYDFCPDTVDQGVESVQALGTAIEKEKTLFLWWD